MLSNYGKFHEYSHEFYSVARTVTGGDWKQNTYIVIDNIDANAIIIDPGDNARGIINFINEKNCKVVKILLTHAHFDHVGALMELHDQFKVACEFHISDLRLLKQAPLYALRFSNKVISPITQYQTFEKDCSNSEYFSVKTLHTPGHTKGSVCYLIGDFVFTGDTLMYQHIGRTDLPGSSPTEIMNSINYIFSNYSDEITVYSGHGRPWTIGEAKKWWKDQKSTPQAHNSFNDFDQ